MTQAERAQVTDDPTDHHLGSAPSCPAAARARAEHARRPGPTWSTASRTPRWPPGCSIPLIYGVDAVHGTTTARRDDLPAQHRPRRDPRPGARADIGPVTAEEISATGPHWAFAPCLCVARDDRWGRTYESFGENPEMAERMATIDGLQGRSLSGPAACWPPPSTTSATAAPTAGQRRLPIDQGNASQQRRLLAHAAPYVPPCEPRRRQRRRRSRVSTGPTASATRQAARQPGSDHSVLKGELGFTGFVVCDWNGIDQMPRRPGRRQVRTAVNAGIDMVMVPTAYQAFVTTLIAEVNAGRVPMSRIDDAVRRILTKKFELGLFEHPFTDRTDIDEIGSARPPGRGPPRGRRVAGAAEEPRPAAAVAAAARTSTWPARMPTTSATSPVAGRSPGRAVRQHDPRDHDPRRASEAAAHGATVTYSEDGSAPTPPGASARGRRRDPLRRGLRRRFGPPLGFDPGDRASRGRSRTCSSPRTTSRGRARLPRRRTASWSWSPDGR